MLGERQGIYAGRNRGVTEQSLDFGAEDDAIGRCRVIERFDSETIAREDKPAQALIPERDREHAVETLECVEAFRFIERDDDLGVRRAVELASACGEFLSQLDVIVDFAVKCKPDRFVGVGHRLSATLR